MNANPKLAEVLREAARRIDTGESNYEFTDMCRCNCGIVAQVAMGIREEELDNLIYNHMRDDRGNRWAGIWADAEGAYECPMTGLPVGSILRALGELGMDYRDVRELEDKDNKEVRKRARLRRKTPNTAKNIVRYLTAWADLLEPATLVEHKPELMPEACRV